MADYREIILHALRQLNARDAAERRRVYDHARALLEERLRAADPPLPSAEIIRQRRLLAGAINDIEDEIAPRPAARAEPAAEPAPAVAAGALAAPRSRSSLVWIGAAVVVAVVAAAAYVGLTRSRGPTGLPLDATVAAGEDLAPGVDGGSTYPELPYYLRRQLVYYRTAYPVGSLVAHKSQNYLYLVMENATARRYSFGLGAACAEMAGARRVVEKLEWPPWRPDTETVRTASTGVMAGGPGNPLGARALDLDDGKSKIHGTNAPKTIGSLVARGCIRMINDDVVDLYNRVAVGTRVIVSN